MTKCEICGVELHPRTEIGKSKLEWIHGGQCDVFNCCWDCMDELQIEEAKELGEWKNSKGEWIE